MHEKIFVVCPFHPQKRFFKCIKCEGIEVRCEICNSTYKVEVINDGEGVKTQYMKVKE